MQRLGFKTKKNKFELHEALLAHREETLPGGWKVTVESEPYYKKERPTVLELKKGLYAPWFDIECEDGHLHLTFHESWLLRWIIWGAAALALAGMTAARILAPNTGASILPGVIALALLLWDFTRERRVLAALSRFVREKILEEREQ